MPWSCSKNELAALIYDSAAEGNFWSLLVGGLAAELGVSERQWLAGLGEPTVTFDEGGEAVGIQESVDPETTEMRELRWLMAHFRNALRVYERVAGLRQELDASQQIVDRLPVGVVLVDEAWNVQFVNHRAAEMLARTRGVKLEANRLVVTDKTLQRRFCRSKTAPVADDWQQNDAFPSLMTTVESRGGDSVRIVVSSYHSAFIEGPLYALWFYDMPALEKVSGAMLMRFFGLTHAEAQLAKAVAMGKSLQQYADERKVTYGTVRSQLNSVFCKTGTHRQADLVRRLLLSVAMWHADEGSHTSSSASAPTLSVRQREFLLALPDGRRMSVAEYGDPRGRPVVVCHSLLGCRLERFPVGQVERRLGIRLLVPDRPGYGRSDVHVSREKPIWHQDLACLLDFLRLGRCALLGLSVGGYYALSASAAMPERITKVVCVSTLSPWIGREVQHLLPIEWRLFAALATTMPGMIPEIIRLQLLGLLRLLHRTVTAVPEKWVAAEPAVSDGIVRDVIIKAITESVHRNGWGVSHDLLTFFRRPAFSPAQLAGPVVLFYGDKDSWVAPTLMKSLANRLSRSELRRLPGAGHLGYFHHWRDILSHCID